ncbi:FtsX-like permease family protein [Actinokineospora guangxiensis]|uniref:FtsX-like permease family protein n=1 Tax=Actinokineospora guangxiensis TaxID=1490288 RepID=A0ABW0EJA7_9PSEU
MLKLAVRSVLTRRSRFLLPLFAVALGVAFVSGALLYGMSVRAVIDRSQPPPGLSVTGEGLTPELVTRLAAVPEVAGAVPRSTGRAFLVGPDGHVVGQPGYASASDRAETVVRGQLPAGAGEVAIDEWSAQRTGYEVGGQVQVVVAGESTLVRVAGVITAADPGLALGGTLVVFDPATARDLFGITAVDVTARGAESAMVDAVQPLLGDELRVESAGSSAAGDGKLTEILLVFAAVAVFVAVFLVANTFSMLTAARAREQALLRAIGAARGQLMRGVLAEAVVVGLVATVAGYLLGALGAWVLGGVFAVGDGPPVPLQVVEPVAMLVAVLVGVGATVVAAYLPARRAAAVPPVAALRSGLPPESKSLRRRAVVGGITVVAGLAALAGAAETQDLLYIGAPLVVLGLVGLTPLLALAATGIVRRPLVAFAGVRGTLALRNIRRNPRRTASTAGALTVGLAICAAVTLPIASIAAKAERDADTGDSADIRVSAIDFADLSPDIPDRIAAVPGASQVTPLAQTWIDLGRDYLQVTGVNPTTIGDFVSLSVRDGSLDNLAEGIAVSTEAATSQGWALGTGVAGTWDDGTQVSRPIVAIYQAPDTFDHGVLVDAASLPADIGPSTVLVKSSAPDTGALKAEIISALDNPTVIVQTRHEHREAEGSRFDVFLAILYALLSVSVLIGALGVVNTMTMSTIERTREIGLLRAVGADRGLVRSTLRWESVLTALLGAVAGLFAGTLVGVAAVRSQGGVPVTIPWLQLAVFVAATATIGILAATIPARRATRLPLLTALHADTE